MSTKAEQERFRRLQEIGCIACCLWERPGVPGDIHHIVDKGYRKHSGGHAATLCLCQWHHDGKPAMGFGKKWMTEKLGPALSESKRDFIPGIRHRARAAGAHQPKAAGHRYGGTYVSEKPAPLHPSVLQRQAKCPHTFDTFIKGAADEVHRCPHCGESRASWIARTRPPG